MVHPEEPYNNTVQEKLIGESRFFIGPSIVKRPKVLSLSPYANAFLNGLK
jgi:hypothetical protein